MIGGDKVESDLLAGSDRLLQAHDHDVIAAGFEAEALPGRNVEAAFLLLHRHSAGAVLRGFVEFDHPRVLGTSPR